MNFFKKHRFLTAVLCTIVVYFTSCTLLYYFEPVSYSSPDLDEYSEYFELYSYFSKNKDENFYIKQIKPQDICSAKKDKRLRYVENAAIAVSIESATFSEVTSLLETYNASVCGYIQYVNFYQIEFNDNLSFEELTDNCKLLSETETFVIVLPDYFEETPTDSDESSEHNLIKNNKCYYEIINAEEAWDIYNRYDENVNVGMIDVAVDYNSNLLDIANKNNYSVSLINPLIGTGAENHGTHVAGIMNVIMSPTSLLHSYNGVNMSTSYWVASFCDMILRKDVKVINISMGYNSYISVSAQLGDDFAINYINDENIFFSEIVNNAIKCNKEFVICIAAGNSTTLSLYRTPFAYFGYGNKSVLSKLDIFNVFDACPDYVDVKYSFFISDSVIDDVADRIIIVGSVGANMTYTYYSNAGAAVDIAAPGENIYSIVGVDKYESMSGTSMAAPFVSGTAAMIFTVNPALSGADVKSIITDNSSETVLAHGYSYPVLDAGKAVNAAECFK